MKGLNVIHESWDMATYHDAIEVHKLFAGNANFGI